MHGASTGIPEKDVKASFISPLNVSSTLYLADLPRNTSYLDLAEIFEKNIGACTISIKR
jgi:hypothetical protein